MVARKMKTLGSQRNTYHEVRLFRITKGRRIPNRIGMPKRIGGPSTVEQSPRYRTLQANLCRLAPRDGGTQRRAPLQYRHEWVIAQADRQGGSTDSTASDPETLGASETSRIRKRNNQDLSGTHRRVPQKYAEVFPKTLSERTLFIVTARVTVRSTALPVRLPCSPRPIRQKLPSGKSPLGIQERVKVAPRPDLRTWVSSE